MNDISLTARSRQPTAWQGQILEFVRCWLLETGAPPTREEIASAFHFNSANAAEQHLQALQRKGLLKLKRRTSRGIRIEDGDADHTRRSIGEARLGRSSLQRGGLAETLISDHRPFRPRADYLIAAIAIDIAREAGSERLVGCIAGSP